MPARAPRWATGLVVGLRQSAEQPAVTSTGAITQPSAANVLDLGAAQQPIPAAVYEQIGAAAAPEQQRPIPVLVYQSLGSPAAPTPRQQPIPQAIYDQLGAATVAQSRQQPIPAEVYAAQ